MLSRIFALTVTALVATVGGTARADFDDTFSAPSPGQLVPISPGSPYTNTSPLNAGLNRTTTATVTTGSATVELGDFGSSSVFALSINRSSTGFGQLDYAYTTPQDLSTSGTDFILDFEFADINVPFSVTLTDSLGATSTQSSTVVSGGATYTFEMSSFAGVDLSMVSNISVAINQGSGSVAAADFSLDRVRIASPEVPPSNPIPAPASFLLLAIGGAGLGLIRKLRAQPVVA